MQIDDNNVRRITFLKTTDGDTFTGLLYLGRPIRPKPLMEVRIRVEGWNAAELRDAEGPWFRDRFDALLRAATLITVDLKYMSYDRIVAAVYLDGQLFDGILKTELRMLRATDHA